MSVSTCALCSAKCYKKMQQLPCAAHATWHNAFLFDEIFFFSTRVFMLHIWMYRAYDVTYSKWSSGAQKRDKPNICDHPNITLGSINKCRSGSGDSPHAPTCGPGLSRSAVAPVLSACFSLSRPSVTTHTHARTYWPAPLLSIHDYNDTFILTLKLFHVLRAVFAFL